MLVRRGEGAEGSAPSRGIKEVKWSIPDGFEVADKPAELNASLVVFLTHKCICDGRSTVVARQNPRHHHTLHPPTTQTITTCACFGLTVI